VVSSKKAAEIVAKQMLWKELWFTSLPTGQAGVGNLSQRRVTGGADLTTKPVCEP